MNYTLRLSLLVSLGIIIPGLRNAKADSIQIRSPFNNLCFGVPNADYRAGNTLAMLSCQTTGTTFNAVAPAGQAGALQIGGKCLDAFMNTNPPTLGLWDCHGGTNQRWTINSGGRSISNAYNGQCVAVRNADPRPGNGMVLWTCINEPNQKWDAIALGQPSTPPPAPAPAPRPVIQPPVQPPPQPLPPLQSPARVNINGMSYHFVSSMGAKCLNVRGRQRGYGVDIIGYECNSELNEQFVFMNNGELRDWGGRSACLDVDRSSRYVKTAQCGRSGNVGWRLTERGEIRVFENSVVTNMCMELEPTRDVLWVFGEQKVRIAACNGMTNQQWRPGMLFRANGFMGIGQLAPYQQGQVANVLSHNGNALLGKGGAGVVIPNGASIVAAGGGNVVANDGAGIVPAVLNSGQIVAAGGGNIVAAGGGNIVAAGGGNIVAGGGGN
ncbi:MAG: ricin-type beta-trefoil lectin domain protein [Candidatus Solibacter usitatus]|nr:ricin-type beta-trefoil lectin domain protein [Candidatus Solibacter usitatus]